ncbi:MAG: PCYCGC domain-containing protein [Acidobacteria bacterium]|nr:PCYCGC domain-containing protein [Acidobacteriota bacterium]
MVVNTPFAFGVVTLALAGALAYAQAPPAKAPASKSAVADVTLPPLPNPGFAPARPLETTRLAYEFAGRHPEVIKYVPCYCGCERNGHSSNESCFVRSRDARGGVMWDAHGWGCSICIDVAAEAARMHALGANPQSIRAAVDRKYASQFPSSTPTPRPPTRQQHQH